MSSHDNWTCRFCGNVNFAHRTVCNMRSCGRARTEAPGPTPVPGIAYDCARLQSSALSGVCGHHVCVEIMSTTPLPRTK